MSRTIIASEQAPKAIGPYSQGVRVGNTVYFSGQIAFDPATMEMLNQNIEVEVNRVFDNLAALVKAAGGEFKDIAKLTVFLTDLANFPVVNEVMGRHFTAPYPARSTIGVASLPRGANVEVEAILILDH